MTIKVTGLVKSYGARRVIDNVSFALSQGEFVSLLGPSGCGKTTTLRCIAGLEMPDAGRIEIGDRVVFDASSGVMVPPHQRNVGMVFQSYAIWPHMTVSENVGFPLSVRGVAKAEIERRVVEVLGLVGLAEYRERKSSELSGGQQQRVAVARAIVQSPDAMLFDEPLSNLDAKLRDRTRAEIRRLQRELKIAAVYVTHDQAEALALSDRVLVMDSGRVVQEGPPRLIYERPTHEFVADVVGAASFLDVGVEPAAAGGSRVKLPGGGALELAQAGLAGRTGRLLLRPDRVTIAKQGSDGALSGARLVGVVRQRQFLGSHFEYGVAVGDALVRVFSRVEIEEGAPVVLGLDARDCVLVEPVARRGEAGA